MTEFSMIALGALSCCKVICASGKAISKISGRVENTENRSGKFAERKYVDENVIKDALIAWPACQEGEGHEMHRG